MSLSSLSRLAYHWSVISSPRVALCAALVMVFGGGCRLVAEYDWASPPDVALDGAVGRGDGAFLDARSGNDARGDALDGAADQGSVVRSDGGVVSSDGANPMDGSAIDSVTADMSVTVDVSPDLPQGSWIQIKIWDYRDCNKLCGAVGRQSVPGPEAATCASGQVLPASAIAAGLVFHHGCWPDGSCTIATPAAQVNGATVFYNLYCYFPNQVKDADLVDRTIGCFCSAP